MTTAAVQAALTTVQNDIASEIAKANASIVQAKKNNDQGQEFQAIEWLYAATATQADVVKLAAAINAPPQTPPGAPTLVSAKSA